MIPYGKQAIDDEDIQVVVDVLKSDWLTTGPKIQEFENAVSDYIGVKHAVAVSSGTAALHAAMHALKIGPGDEVVLPSMTFAATANCVVYQGATPVFVDVSPDTLLIDPGTIEAKLTSRTRAIIAVDYAGQPCVYDRLQQIAEKHRINLVADACHALGAEYKGKKVGGLADLTVFSFHPVKHITTGEGGMITTDDESLAQRMRVFRNHGITSTHSQREAQGSWFYEIEELGYNYRITDFQCALGRSQLRKLPQWLEKRRNIAAQYDTGLAEIGGIKPLTREKNVLHAYHLYVVKIEKNNKGFSRSEIYKALRDSGIGVNVHYIPVHLHPFYKRAYRTGPGLCPAAEEAYEKILSLPMYPTMSDHDVKRVIETLANIMTAHTRRFV